MSDSQNHIQSIWRFPIKSFQGESIASTHLQEGGILGDRPLALVEKESGRVVSGKHGKLGGRVLDFQARYESEPTPDSDLPSIVATVDELEIRSDDLQTLSRCCSEALGVEVEVVRAGAGPMGYETYWPELDGLPLSDKTIELPLGLAEAGSFADLEPLHLLTTGSLRHLARLAKDSQVAEGRFRPSILIDSGNAGGFVENDWVDRKATLGGATIAFGALSPRCIMTTRAQAGFPKDPAILRTLVQENRQPFMGMDMPCLGIYARVVEPGPIAVGDSLQLL